MKAAIIILAVMLVIACLVIFLLARKLFKGKYDPKSADKFIQAIDGLIVSRLNELEVKLKNEYKTDNDVNNGLDDLGFTREDDG